VLALDEMTAAEKAHGYISRAKDQDPYPYLSRVREAVAREAQSFGASYPEGQGPGLRYTAFDRHAGIARQTVAHLQESQRTVADFRGGLKPLARTFAVDVPACPRCHGRMKLLARVKGPASIARYLATVGQLPLSSLRSRGRASPDRSRLTLARARPVLASCRRIRSPADNPIDDRRRAMNVSQAEKANRFQALHARPGAFVIPNPWDAGTARILASLGFEALTTTSAGLAFVLGRRDGDGSVTREDSLANAKAIVDATDLPVAADLENGYGDSPDAAAETIRLAGEVGLVGASIEDTTGDPKRPIYDFQHSIERVGAAAAAARALPYPFVFVARAENFLHGRPDLDDTIRRLQAFEAVGADVLYAPGLTRAEDIRAVCSAVRKPVNVVMGLKSAAFSVAELAALGVRRISVGSALSRAALGAFVRAAREIQEHGTFRFAEDALPYAEANAFVTNR
jgi:2-methylisocitrate lyase-like PEP mutase family enzyme